MDKAQELESKGRSEGHGLKATSPGASWGPPGAPVGGAWALCGSGDGIGRLQALRRASRVLGGCSQGLEAGGVGLQATLNTRDLAASFGSPTLPRHDRKAFVSFCPSKAPSENSPLAAAALGEEFVVTLARGA